MGELTLYDYPFSGNAYKVRLALHALDIPYRRVIVDILAGETRTDAFRARNPVGQVLTVTLPDGRHLAESTAILGYLAEGTALLPADRYDRALVHQWMGFEQTNVDGVISRARFRRACPDAIPTPEAAFASWYRQGERTLDVLEAHLAGRAWMVAEAFTIADIALYGYVHCADEAGHDLGARPALTAWLARVAARPSHVPMFG